MKTIKVIDSLNILANKEYDKLPKKVKFENYIYEFDEKFGDYVYPKKDGVIVMFLSSKIFNTSDINKILNHELEIIEEPILDKKEREYLSAVIRPFRNAIDYICKYSHDNNLEFIRIVYKDGYAFVPCQCFPHFPKNKMYKGMKLKKEYTLRELGL